MGQLLKDAKKKLVRVEGQPLAYFREQPTAILESIRMSAQLGLDIEMETFKAMQESVSGLSQVSTQCIREEFEEILSAEHAAKGLRIAVAAGAMPYVLGDTYPPKTKFEIDQFNGLLENLDLTKSNIECRFPMLFMCFDNKRAEAVIDYLQFDEETTLMYKDALVKVQDLYFIVQPHIFKKFLYENGREKYDYWESLAKQQRKLYDHPENRIMSRYYMLQEFQQLRMAIYKEDLAVTEEDLLAVGVPEKKLDIIMDKLVYRVHYFPRKNTKEYLISEAKRYNKNPFSKFLRDVHFFR